jgi:hypothetical protein|tara:strand:+ start:352 stop:537 length:186 start_codon:yes stop_codon:yes gene_type:complete
MVNDKGYLELMHKAHKLENQLYELTGLISQGASLGDIMRVSARIRDDLENNLEKKGSDESE